MTQTRTRSWAGSWERFVDLKVGDTVKVPKSSHSVYETLEQSIQQPGRFRTIKEIRPGTFTADGTEFPTAEPASGEISIWFTDGFFGCYPAEASTLKVV